MKRTESPRPSAIARESSLPLTLGLLVDTSRSQIEVLERERSASDTFLSQVLREKIDRALVVSFDEKVQVLQDMTSSRQDLEAALARLQIPGKAATLLYEAVRQSSENLMRKQKGRKAFILLTDGVSFRDKTSIGTAIEFAQRADTILYTIRFAGHNPAYRPGRALVLGMAEEHGKHALQRMAAETGGEAFEVSADEPIEKVFSEIEELLRNQYSLGYTPDRPSHAGKFHRIRLTVKNRALIVRTRDGYYSQ
ncbi:MAG TPA: VWA domain-containing protein [Bryobacteraceae bacterium]|nr:VWA domain-containing protein [Bryobacteraceae bacterium]